MPPPTHVSVKGLSRARASATSASPAAEIGSTDGDYSLVSGVPAATDLWRSHILRVATCTAPPVTRALLREQLHDRMSTDELREVARRLNRLSTNIVLALYDEADATKLIAELRNDQETAQ